MCWERCSAGSISVGMSGLLLARKARAAGGGARRVFQHSPARAADPPGFGCTAWPAGRKVMISRAPMSLAYLRREQVPVDSLRQVEHSTSMTWWKGVDAMSPTPPEPLPAGTGGRGLPHVHAALGGGVDF